MAYLIGFGAGLAIGFVFGLLKAKEVKAWLPPEESKKPSPAEPRTMWSDR